MRTSANQELGILAENNLLTGHGPNVHDDCHFLETAEVFFQGQSSDSFPSYLFKAERSLHQCSLWSEKIQLTEDKLITFVKKVCCQVSLCLSDMQEQRERLVHQFVC